MGDFLIKRYVTGSPTAGVPHGFYNDVDEVLTNLTIYNGHMEKNGNLWTIIYDKGEEGGTGGGPHRFRPTPSDTNGVAVDIALGGWNQNGTIVTDSAVALGDTTNPYIIATLTQGTAKPLVPASVALSAASAAAEDSDFATVRTIAKINYDSQGNYSSATRYQVGDVYQRLSAIQTGAAWADGSKAGTTRSIVSSIQYDDTAHKLQVKFVEIEVRSGSVYVGVEDAAWTDITTAAACP